VKENVQWYYPPESPEFAVFWSETVSPLRDTVSLIERDIKEARDKFFGFPESAKSVIIEESLRTDNKNTVTALLDLLFLIKT
jgi:hypothetical protein